MSTPRVFKFAQDRDIDADVRRVHGGTSGKLWVRLPGTQYMWRSGSVCLGVATLLLDEKTVTEVVGGESGVQ